MKPQKRKAKTSKPKVGSESQPTPHSEKAGTIRLQRFPVSEQDLGINECDDKLRDLVSRIEKGEQAAMAILAYWATASIHALNSLKNVELLKECARDFPAWPVLASISGLLPETQSRLQQIELGKNVQEFDVSKLKQHDTVERYWVGTLLCLIWDIPLKLRFVPPEKKFYAVIVGEKPICLPIDVIEECEHLPAPFLIPPQEVVDRYWPVMEKVFKLLTDNKFEEIPELRRKVELYAKRKSLEPGSPEAVSQIRSDILKKLKETFVTYIAAPLTLTDNAVRLAVIGKLGWIRRQQARFEAQPRQSEREMVSGESHYFLGRRYRLRVIPHDGAAKVVLRNRSRMELHVRAEDTAAQRVQVLQQWYRQQLRKLIPPLLEKWQTALGVQVADWRIKKMKTRWGTCTAEARRIWLNLELAKKPVRCLEYIIVHEMVHLLERHHNDRFIAVMDKSLPHWRSCRHQLNAAPLGHATWSY